MIHRAPAWVKLLGLAVAMLLISYFGRTAIGLAVVAGSLLALFLLAGLSLREVAQQVWKLKIVLLIVLVPQLIFAGVLQGLFNSFAVISGLLLAGLVSLTTKTADIVDLIKRITKSKSFALLIALSINSIALVTGFAKNISESGLARGVKPNPLRQIITLFVVSLRYADEYAESLAARGVRV